METGGHYIAMLPGDWSISTSHGLVTRDLCAYYTLYCVHMIISWLNQGSRSWSGCNRGAPAEEANFNFWMNWWSSCTRTVTLIIQHPGS